MISLQAQLSEDRIKDIADMKVKKFTNILDLTPKQAEQFRKQTAIMLLSQSEIAATKDMVSKFQSNLDSYYKTLTSLDAKQLGTLKLMDQMDRSTRRNSYIEMMESFGQTSEFGVAVASYNWNVAIPILVSFRKDLDRYISPTDQVIIADLRTQILSKYDFIIDAQQTSESKETNAIVSAIQDEIIKDINESALPLLLKKYDDKISAIRNGMKTHEIKIKTDISELYELYVGENYKSQIVSEQEFIGLLGIGKLMRDSFFLLLDGDSRTNSFKINATHLMAIGVAVNDQF